MFDWVSRDALVDLTINVVPAIVLAYFFALTIALSTWRELSFTTLLAHGLTLFPLVVLWIATYVVARAVVADAEPSTDDGRPSLYTPAGAFRSVLAVVLICLLGAVVFLVGFTTVRLP